MGPHGLGRAGHVSETVPDQSFLKVLRRRVGVVSAAYVSIRPPRVHVRPGCAVSACPPIRPAYNRLCDSGVGPAREAVILPRRSQAARLCTTSSTHAFRALVVNGSLTVRWPDGNAITYTAPAPGPSVRIGFLTDDAVRRVTLNPSLALGECYMEGSFVVGPGTTLYAFVDALTAWMAAGGRLPMERALSAAGRLAKPVMQLNPARRSRRNVARHYDLNGQLYAMMLDPDMNYSCAYFPTGTETLAEAQRAKQRHIARKLLLDRPGLEVLDIGCGWGGMALTLAREFGARVTGVTLSTEQLTRARQRAQEEGLADRVRFELADYRSVRGSFDRIVSVGMFEHVGVPQYRTFFDTVHRLLIPGGVALLHAIGRSDGPGSTNPWLQKYIFPGGYSPALSEVLGPMEKSGLVMTDLEVLRTHYATTLQHWRANFDRNRAAVQAMYDAEFVRMFELYLIGSEMAFRRQGHMVFQIQLAREPVAVPLSRDYMYPDIHSHPQAAAVSDSAAPGYGVGDHEHDREPAPRVAPPGPVPTPAAAELAGGAGAVGRAAREQPRL